MKTTLMLACLLFATAAFGQTSAPTMQSFQVTSHPEHAMPQGIATEQNLAGFGAVSIAQGDQPVWQFAPVIHVEPLGDTARTLKKEKTDAKKAVIVWEN